MQRQARENKKENFIIKCESDFDNSDQKLYDVIVNNDTSSRIISLRPWYN